MYEESPYDTLGISRHSTTEEVKAAYRARAKAEHPDKGGSVEKFGALKRAADCLSDPERRARFDQTGKMDGGGPDLSEGQAMELAFGTVVKMLNQIESNQSYFGMGGGIGPGRDPLKMAQSIIENQKRDFKQKIADLEKNSVKIERMAKRFKSKPGAENRIGKMFLSEVAGGHRMMEGLKRHLSIHDRAIAILLDHEYREAE